MTSLVLIRHGETDWNQEKRWQGQIDVPLNAAGLLQAEQIALTLKDIPLHAIYSSDLQRAVQTATPLALQKGLPVQVDPRLREIHQGDWQGLHIDEIRSRYKTEFEQRKKNPLLVAPPGGETAMQVRQRVLAALQDILRFNPPDSRIAIVSHGFALAVILTSLQDTPIGQVWDLVPKNGAIIYCEVDQNGKSIAS